MLIKLSIHKIFVSLPFYHEIFHHLKLVIFSDLKKFKLNFGNIQIWLWSYWQISIIQWKNRSFIRFFRKLKLNVFRMLNSYRMSLHLHWMQFVKNQYLNFGICRICLMFRKFFVWFAESIESIDFSKESYIDEWYMWTLSLDLRIYWSFCLFFGPILCVWAKTKMMPNQNKQSEANLGNVCC